jgi:predicted nucleic acid-binding protein
MLPDETDAYAAHVMEMVAKDGGRAPSHWPMEITNGLLIAQRRRRITNAVRLASLADARTLPIELDGQTPSVVWTAASDLALSHKLTVYDAAYLELAKRLRLPLATLDADLRKAAKAEGVAV